MTLEIIVLGLGIVLVVISVVVLLGNCAYENGKLKELVKQKEAEIKQLKRNMRDRD